MDAKTEDNPTNLNIEYVDVELQQVLRYFVNGYKRPGGTVTNHESFVDTAKGKVVFKLFITTPATKEKP